MSGTPVKGWEGHVSGSPPSRARSPHKYQAGSLILTGHKAMCAASIQGAAELSCRCDFAAADGECPGWGQPTSQGGVLTLLWFENPAPPPGSLLGNLQVRELTPGSPGRPLPSLGLPDCLLLLLFLSHWGGGRAMPFRKTVEG